MQKKTERKLDLLIICIVFLAFVIFVGNSFLKTSNESNKQREVTSSVETEEPKKVEPFVKVYDGYNYDVVYDIQTGVMYAVSDGAENKGVFTMLVNDDGTPKIYSEFSK